MVPGKVRDIPASNGADEVRHICFERIIPHELDPETTLRHRIRDAAIANAARAGRPLDAAEEINAAHMAIVETKKWNAGSELRCRFLDGSPKMRKQVEALAHQWEQYVPVKFKFVKRGAAEVRISFSADAGSWSAVGRDALNTSYFPIWQPTMNYGWLRDDTAEDEYCRVVLHEFGHALGAIHEHQSPAFNRKWNRAAVLKYFQGPPNYWSVEDIDHNVLQKYSPKGIIASRYDPKSIMLYMFDAGLFSDGLGPTNSNSSISQYDIDTMKRIYAPAGAPVGG